MAKIKIIKNGRYKEVAPGTRFGRLTVLRCEQRPNPHYKGGFVTWAILDCSCGKRIESRLYNLLRGNTRSCGCLMRETAAKTAQRMGDSNLRHGGWLGGRPTRLWVVWRGMKNRCYNPKAEKFKWYGAEGIRVCDAWMDYAHFEKWALESGYQEGLTIERINPYGNYEPSNCEWITRSENTKRAHAYGGIPARTCSCGRRWRDPDLDHCEHCHNDWEASNERAYKLHHYGKCMP